MACLTICKVCGTGLIDIDLCNKCSDLIAQKTLKGETIDLAEIKKQVQDAQDEENRIAMQKLVDNTIDSAGRDNWRNYKAEKDRLKNLIEDAIDAAKDYKDCPEVQSLVQILEG